MTSKVTYLLFVSLILFLTIMSCTGDDDVSTTTTNNPTDTNNKVFSIDSQSLDFGTSDTEITLTATNITSKPIEISVSATGGSSSWLKVGKNLITIDTGASGTLDLSVDRTGLKIDKYKETLSFESENQSLHLPVNMEIRDGDGDGVADMNDADKDNDGLIEIYTIEDLNNIRKDLEGLRGSLQGIASENFKGYKLMNNLDFKAPESYASGVVNTSYTNGKGWEPIGNSTDPFSKEFEGNGYTISNLFINRPSTDHIGLFGHTSAALIKNVGLEEVNVKGSNYVGGLVGENNSTISHSYATGSVTGSYDVGGLVGYNYFDSTIRHSYATGSVTGDNGVGGLVGFNFIYSIIRHSYATGSVTGSNNHVGGLVGSNWISSIISHSYARGM